jgi:putative ABC transport system permease protein
MSTLIFAWRSLRRAPAFAIAAALTLSIGVGATTAIFTVLDTILLKPLPYREPDRLAGIWIALPGMGFKAAPQSTSSYFTFRRFSRSIEGMAIVSPAAVNIDSDDDGVKPERIRSAVASASAFTLLGVTFQRGRGFSAEEDAPRGPHVVVISDGLWRRRYGADPNVIGKTIRLNGVASTIVGVAPAGFQYPNAATQLWQPFALDSTTPFGGPFAYAGFVRMKPGVTIDALQRELNTIMPRISELYPNIGPGTPTQEFLTNTHASVAVHRMRDDVVGTFGNIVWISGTAGILLLLISFANVASLLLTRAEGRQRELAVRVALGAGPARVISQFLAESLLLAFIGGALGLLLAITGVRTFVHAGPPGIPRLSEMGVNATVVVFAFVVTLVLAALCSVVPAIRYDTRRLAARLRDGARGGTTGRDRQRARRTLVVSQVAFATVLVAGAGMLFQSMERLRHVEPGFDAHHTLAMFLSLPRTSYRNDTAVVRFTTRLVDRVSQVPGVSAAGVTSKVPFNTLGQNFGPVTTDADPDGANKLAPSAEAITATGGYFKAMGIPLLAGRTFEREDRQDAQEVIIDQSLAVQRWHDSTGRAAVGRKLWFSPSLRYTVIGVVGAVHDTSLAAPPNSLVYFPQAVFADTNQSSVTRVFAVVTRTTGDPHALIQAVQRAIADVDKSLPAFAIASMNETLEQSMARLSFVMTIIGVTATVALVLASIGLYGVLAYIVSLRSREISVRLAMGAMPATVARLVTRQGAGLAGAGVVAGVAVFLASSRLLRAALVGVARPDVLTIAVVTAVLMAIALAASWIPARRAARVDPARALAGE